MSTGLVERTLEHVFASAARVTARTQARPGAAVPSWGAPVWAGATPLVLVTWTGHDRAATPEPAAASGEPARSEPTRTEPRGTALTGLIDDNPVDDNPVDDNPVDDNPVDAGPVGAGPVGAGPVGAGPVGAGPVGAGPVGAGPVGAGPVGAGPVGVGLVGVLERVEVADLDDGVLLDVAARWQEVISWATAMQSRATGEIARRRGWTAEHNAASAEISARLRVPQGEANKLMARGTALTEHPQVMNALHHGLIDTTKADILLHAGNPLTHQERHDAITRYLPQAPDRTRRWLREAMNAYATTLHGTSAVVQHARTRRAVYLDPADNHMAWISANLPATDATAVWDAIDQAAHTLHRTPGTTRTLAQARADALVAITTGRIIVPPHPECAPTPTPDTATHTTTHEDSATHGPDGGPGTGADRAADLAADRAGIGSGKTSGTGTTDGTSTTTTSTPATHSGDAGPDGDSLPRTTVPATGCTCGGCLCGGTTVRVIPVKPQIRVTVPATMLLGLDDTPGHLDGYGPIPAEVAARIATDATWHRLITDPVTGILTDYSTTTYQPGKTLRHAVTTRDQTCCFPQCDRPAHHADLDHIHPYDHDLDPDSQPPGTPGQTRAHNLQPLCRAHHLAKTHHGWTVTRDPDTGTTTWTAPTRHTYTRPPTQTGTVYDDITTLTHDTRRRLGTDHDNRDQSRTPPPRTVPDEPPF